MTEDSKLAPVVVSQSLLIVHLTDLHVAGMDSGALKALKTISSAIGGLIDEPTELAVALTGDIAYSGRGSQYELVADALRILGEQLKTRPVTKIHFIPSPGNHDCDFSAMPEAVRKAMLASIDSEGSEDLVNALAPTQREFFEFARSISDSSLIRHNDLLSEVDIHIGDFKLKIIALNTALTSSLHERPGILRIPSSLLLDVVKESNFCVVLAHHPLNWFAPEDSVRLSEWLDSNADLVLLGHEHRLDEFTLIRKRLRSSVDHEIGLPMDDGNNQCGFKCLRIDLASQVMSYFDVTAKDETWEVREVRQCPLQHNEGRDRGVLRFTKSHEEFLSDPGAGFSHPRINRQIEFSDLFVPPDFREHRAEKHDVERSSGGTRADDLCSDICESSGRYVVFGSEQSGKTTFAKYLIKEAKANHLVPLYLDCHLLKSSNRGEIRGWYNSAIAAQYEEDARDQLAALDVKKIIIVVDNIHAIPGGADGINGVLAFLSSKTLMIVSLTADSPAVSIVAAGQFEDEVTYWKDSVVIELLPLGHRRRGELIRRWVSLGRSSVDDAVAIEAEVRQTKRLLDRVLGKNSLPKYPIFVLALLQQLEGLKDNITAIANGSQGYLFESLITQAIDRNVRSHKIAAVHDFLATVAERMSKRDGKALSQTAVDEVIQEFLAKYVKIDGPQLLRELLSARIIILDSGLYGFRYQYLYYYYIAKWICANRNTQAGQALLEKIVSFIHTEQSSNVLIFVAHLGFEELVIQRVRPLLDSLFAEQKVKQLEDYSALSVRFRTSEQRWVLLQGPASLVSDQTHSAEDAAESAAPGGSDPTSVEDGLKLNTALKGIHTLGQVLKSRSTSIGPDRKIEIAESIISASRRLMSFLYDVTEQHAESIVRIASEAFEEAFKIDKQQAVEVANSLIGSIVSAIARICISRSADAISSAELEPLVVKLSERASDDDTRLILLVAKIVGSKNYPKEQVEDYLRSIRRSNVLPINVLSSTVARRFYLDPPDRAVRDSACDLLNIDVKRLSTSILSNQRGPRSR